MLVTTGKVSDENTGKTSVYTRCAGLHNPQCMDLATAPLPPHPYGMGQFPVAIPDSPFVGDQSPRTGASDWSPDLPRIHQDAGALYRLFPVGFVNGEFLPYGKTLQNPYTGFPCGSCTDYRRSRQIAFLMRVGC